MSGPFGGLIMLAIAGILAWAWWAGFLTSAIGGTITAFTTPRAKRAVDPLTGRPLPSATPYGRSRGGSFDLQAA